MSRTIKGGKGAGYDYWGRRPCKWDSTGKPGRFTKRLTHRAERRSAKKEVE